MLLVSKSMYNLEREVIINEYVVPYKRRYCFIKEFIPDKPIRFGIKVWLLASLINIFIWKMEVYFNERRSRGKHGLGYHVIDHMMDIIEHRSHCLVEDNLFPV